MQNPNCFPCLTRPPTVTLTFTTPIQLCSTPTQYLQRLYKEAFYLSRFSHVLPLLLWDTFLHQSNQLLCMVKLYSLFRFQFICHYVKFFSDPNLAQMYCYILPLYTRFPVSQTATFRKAPLQFFYITLVSLYSGFLILSITDVLDNQCVCV